VGELAKCYYPAPEENNIDTLDDDEALRRTRALLEQENATIYEAAFAYKNPFIRADILVKTGNHFKLIEVKSKSYHEEKVQYGFYNRTGTALSSGEFVGVVAYNPDQRIPQKMFHAEVPMDFKKKAQQQVASSDLPQQTQSSQVIQENYLRIKQEAGKIVQDELERIMNTPGLEGVIVRKEERSRKE